MLYWGSGTAIGAAPYASTFAVSPQKLAAEVVTEAFVVVWPSGARLETTKTWRPHDNKKWRFTFSRPPGAPGMDIDLKHAASLEAASFARAQAQRAEQQERDATAASLVDSYVKGRYGSNDRDTSIQGPDPAVTCDAQRLTIGPATMDQRYRINCR